MTLNIKKPSKVLLASGWSAGSFCGCPATVDCRVPDPVAVGAL